MIVIRARNVQCALPLALDVLRGCGVQRDSRNGPVVMFPEPVTTVYLKPAERVIFWPERDANPFFHLMESLWMLGGRNDVEFVAKYVSRMRDFSDDGVTFHGAYGHRWRNHFHFDQLLPIIVALRTNRDDRRQVLSMWDATVDLGRFGKDLPCNLQAIFQVAVDGRLDMTVTNRSNDIVWGAYGANAVHFSYLHEYMARSIGVEQGVYRQMSANFHAYLPTLQQVSGLMDRVNPSHPKLFNPYDGDLAPHPLMEIPRSQWDVELEMFLTNPTVMGLRDPFFRRVALPMFLAHRAFRTRKGAQRYDEALEYLEACRSPDWALAGTEWIERRRAAAKARAEDSGVAYD